MDKNSLRELFDKAVNTGNQDEAILYGSELTEMGDYIHVMLGYKQLQERSPENYVRAALEYVRLAYQLSTSCRNSTTLINSTWRMNVKETADAANVADLYSHPTFDALWDFLVHEYMCWNIIAAENTTGTESDEYRTELKNVMDTTVIRHKGDWILEYMEFFHAHRI